MSKRVWKLQDFVAHAGKTHCARLGEKSGQVLATGGDDKRVNIWKVGKPNAMMSLTGHSSAVECLVFDKQEEVLVVGCAGGSMQVWNLEYRKMAGTLAGHRTACESVEFHPYGEFFASGSADTNLKIWDLRRKSCIQTYRGHTSAISTIRFSPHGRWVATGGQDNQVKLWDLTAGKLMRDIDVHKGPITSIAFHPKEYLLATGSMDRTAKLWGLESFQACGSTDPGTSPVQAVKFYVEEQAVISASQDQLRVYSTENLSTPVDTIDVNWTGLQDMRLCFPEEKLIAVTAEGPQVGIWVADLSRRDGFTAKGSSGGRAYSAGPPAVLGARGSRPQAAAPDTSTASRATPASASRHAALSAQARPPLGEDDDEGDAPQLLPSPPPTRAPPRQASALPLFGDPDAVPSSYQPSSPPHAASSPHAASPLASPDLSAGRVPSKHAPGFSPHGGAEPTPLSTDAARDRFAPATIASGGCLPDRPPPTRAPPPVGTPTAQGQAVDVTLLAAAPRAHSPMPPARPVSRAGFASEADAPARLGLGSPTVPPAQRRHTPGVQEPLTGEQINQLLQPHSQMRSVLQRRLGQVRRLKELWARGNLVDLEAVLQMPTDHAVFCDFLRAAMRNKLEAALNLEACQLLLPMVRDLMSSKYEDFAAASIQFAEVLLQHFGGVIADTRGGRAGITERNLDLVREERLLKSDACYDQFREIFRLLKESRLLDRFGPFRQSLQAFLQRS